MYPGYGPDERTSFTPYSAFDVPQDLREFGGRYDVEAMARRVRNFRYAEEWTMMILGGWIATIPEVPVKTGLGKIVWETRKPPTRSASGCPSCAAAARRWRPASRRIGASPPSSRRSPSPRRPISPSRRSRACSTY